MGLATLVLAGAGERESIPDKVMSRTKYNCYIPLDGTESELYDKLQAGLTEANLTRLDMSYVSLNLVSKTFV